jgi:transposase InsO family protein
LAAEGKVNISSVCRQLGYSKQAYYKSVHVKQLQGSKWDLVKGKVLALRARMPRLGGRKLYYLLQETFKAEEISVGRDKLFELLREEGLLVAKKKKYTVTTNSKHWMRKYPNKIKGIKIKRAEQLWVADITYVNVQKGNCYLHLITDAYSKRIMGYHASETLAATATLMALKMAVKSRQYSDSLIHHSDRGLQYCSSKYTKFLEKKRIRISMTEDGSPYENAIAERVNGILKDEWGLGDIFKSIAEVRKEIQQIVPIYNEQRPHFSNHLLTPKQMHNQKKLTPIAWHKKATRI